MDGHSANGRDGGTWGAINAAQAIVDLFIDEEFNHTSVMLRPPGPKASQEVNSCSTAMTLFHI